MKTKNVRPHGMALSYIKEGIYRRSDGYVKDLDENKCEWTWFYKGRRRVWGCNRPFADRWFTAAE